MFPQNKTTLERSNAVKRHLSLASTASDGVVNLLISEQLHGPARMMLMISKSGDQAAQCWSLEPLPRRSLLLGSLPLSQSPRVPALCALVGLLVLMKSQHRYSKRKAAYSNHTSPAAKRARAGSLSRLGASWRSLFLTIVALLAVSQMSILS